ncbi:MAG: nucleotide sugar dehydrogenase [Ignavibacteriae bacterium]|nr:nucleotide sugar dehydrogenase [Ignavibacteriota bacterium]MCB0752987.1 nucleotide sugar dehydrogenase [Ignavibacteriota bacterium]
MNIDLKNKTHAISVIGLGYVGLPVALHFAKIYRVIGFDINTEKIKLLQKKIDLSGSVETEEFENSDIFFTSDESDLFKAQFHIVCVPTDVDENNIPNLNPLLNASETLGKSLKRGDIIVYESTVYPGCTEEECIPKVESVSGLIAGVDFFYAYSPERINPGDKNHTFKNTTKIISACDAITLNVVAEVYNSIITHGLYKAPSIKVAEAAKVVENIQRDLNISLMNELAIIFDKLGINTKEVIDAASTKWNFHKYVPGLVGGHCISIDPLYLIHKARLIGHEPQVIAASRRVNDYVPNYLAKKVVSKLIEEGKNLLLCNILIMGVTFKENLPDIRNSKVLDLIKALREYHLNVVIQDPNITKESQKELLELTSEFEISDGKFDCIIIAVGHNEYKNMSPKKIKELSKDRTIVFDVKGVLNDTFGIDYYWQF